MSAESETDEDHAQVAILLCIEYYSIIVVLISMQALSNSQHQVLLLLLVAVTKSLSVLHSFCNYFHRTAAMRRVDLPLGHNRSTREECSYCISAVHRATNTHGVPPRTFRVLHSWVGMISIVVFHTIECKFSYSYSIGYSCGVGCSQFLTCQKL